jgi:hypothetical protein
MVPVRLHCFESLYVSRKLFRIEHFLLFRVSCGQFVDRSIVRTRGGEWSTLVDFRDLLTVLQPAEEH